MKSGKTENEKQKACLVPAHGTESSSNFKIAKKEEEGQLELARAAGTSCDRFTRLGDGSPSPRAVPIR